MHHITNDAIKENCNQYQGIKAITIVRKSFENLDNELQTTKYQ